MFIEEDLVSFQPSLLQQVIKYVLKHVLDPAKLITRAGSFVVKGSKFRQADRYKNRDRNRELIQL